MPNFGYETAGSAGSRSLLEDIVGSKFRFGGGIVYSITAYVQYDGGGGTEKMKCAIYDNADDLVPNSETEEWSIPIVALTSGWHTFNIIGTKPILTAGDYYIVAWGSDIGFSTNNLWYDAGAVNQGVSETNLYIGAFPGSIALWTYTNRKYSIYCHYVLGKEYFAEKQTNEQELNAVQSNE